MSKPITPSAGTADLAALDAWIKRFMQPKPRDMVPLTEIDHGDGTYHTERPDGSVSAIYGTNFRNAMLAKKVINPPK